MQLIGRGFRAGSGYRYGFNTQEKSSELSNSLFTAKFWEYDSRVARRWNIDPVTLAPESPYLVNGGNPIIYTDPLGDFKRWTGAFLNRLFTGGGKIGKNKNGEWYVSKNRGVEVNNKGEVVANSEYYYGKGRHKNSTLVENALAEFERQQLIVDFTREGIWDPNMSPSESKISALRLGTDVLLLNPLKSGTAAVNGTRVVETTDEVKGVIGTGVVDAAKGGMSAYETALAGGKHSGFLKNYLGRSTDEMNKAIRSMQTGKEGISVHLDKIANPTKYVPGWNTLRPGHQQSLIKGWQNTVTKHTEQIQILQTLLGK